MRRFLAIQLFLLAYITAGAEPVGRSQAMATASAFLQQRGRIMGTANSGRRLSPAGSSQSDSQPYYVFNSSDGGYVIVSGESTTVGILGYSDQGEFDYDDAPEGMKYLLSQYAGQVSLIQSGTASAASTISKAEATWADVEPLIETTWNQSVPYNYYMYSTDYATGCVATCIAQIMYYWKHPTEECGQVPGYTDSNTTYAALAATEFEWDKMELSYAEESYDEDEDHAVALLMEYVGHAVKTAYGTSSGAAPSYIPSALSDYFGYSDRAACLWRDCYSNEEWHEMIYGELSKSRPVEYHGYNESGNGHSFICDGYQNGYFHINWGWGGAVDGYFLLDLLDADTGGLGGNGIYTLEQGAIVNIAPEGQLEDALELADFQPMSLTIESGEVYVKGVLHYGKNPDIRFKAECQDDGTSKYVDTLDSILVVNNCYQYYCALSRIVQRIGASAGTTYTVSPCTYDSSTGLYTEFFDDGTAIKLVFDDDGGYTVTMLPEASDTEIEFVGVSENLFVNTATNVTFRFTNNNSFDVNDIYILCAVMDGSVVAQSAMQVYLSGGGTEETTFYYTPPSKGEVSYMLYNNSTGKTVWTGDTEYTVSRYPVSVRNYDFAEGVTSDSGYYYCLLTATLHNNSSEDFDSANFIAFHKRESDSGSNYRYSNEYVKGSYNVIEAGGDLNLTFYVLQSSYTSGDEFTLWFTDQYGTQLVEETLSLVAYEESAGVFKTIGDAGYSTFSAGFGVTVPEGITAYTAEFNSGTTAVDLTKVTLDVIPANTGLIINGTAGETYLFASTDESGSALSDNQLVATSECTALTEDDLSGSTYYGLNANKDTFGKIVAAFTLPVNSAVLKVGDGTVASSLGIFVLDEEDDIATAITDVAASETSGNGAIYNLAGQRVSSTRKGGIYIQDGRKLIAK